MAEILHSIKDGTTYLEGELTRQNLSKTSLKHADTILKSESLVIDLSKLYKVDTAGLAWLLLLVEKSSARNQEISFVQASEDLVRLAQLSGVEGILPSLS